MHRKEMKIDISSRRMRVQEIFLFRRKILLSGNAAKSWETLIILYTGEYSYWKELSKA